MDNLYVVEPGSFMRVAGETLVIEKKGHVLSQIPAKGLERLTLMGRCSMTGAVLDFLIDQGVDTVFMTLGGRFRARLLLDGAGHVRLRQLQYKMLGKPGFCLSMAKAIVRGKIKNQCDLILRKSYRQEGNNLKRTTIQLKALERRVSRSSSLEEIRGIEGAASRAFYHGFGRLIKNPDFSFTGRNKRPPLDPVNALLSFVYTLFTNETVNAIKASGLDPYLGALHEPLSGRPSLACDLVEEWRATAENFVLTIINKRMVKPDDFVKTGRKERPLEMAPPFLRALIKAYEKKMAKQVSFRQGRLGLRWVLHQRIRDFIKYLEDPDANWESDIRIY